MGDTYPMQTIAVNFEQQADNTPINIGVSTEGAPSETWFKIDNFRLFRIHPSFLIGDVTGDGNKNAQDVAAIVNIILGRPLQTYNLNAADVNRNGSTTLADVTMLTNQLQ